MLQVSHALEAQAEETLTTLLEEPLVLAFIHDTTLCAADEFVSQLGLLALPLRGILGLVEASGGVETALTSLRKQWPAMVHSLLHESSAEEEEELKLAEQRSNTFHGFAGLDRKLEATVQAAFEGQAAVKLQRFLRTQQSRAQSLVSSSQAGAVVGGVSSLGARASALTGRTVSEGRRLVEDNAARVLQRGARRHVRRPSNNGEGAASPPPPPGPSEAGQEGTAAVVGTNEVVVQSDDVDDSPIDHLRRWLDSTIAEWSEREAPPPPQPPLRLSRTSTRAPRC